MHIIVCSLLVFGIGTNRLYVVQVNQKLVYESTRVRFSMNCRQSFYAMSI